MIQIDNTIVSLDLLEQFFCCDLATCKGICCIEGDSGAPLEQIEIAEIEKVLPIIWDDLSEKAKLIIKEQGFHYTDIEGDIVTSIIDGKECVFSYIDNGVCKCAKIYGEKNKIPAYIFLKDALVRRFGNDWYQQLKQIAELYKKEKDSK